ACRSNSRTGAACTWPDGTAGASGVDHSSRSLRRPPTEARSEPAGTCAVTTPGHLGRPMARTSARTAAAYLLRPRRRRHRPGPAPPGDAAATPYDEGHRRGHRTAG